MVKKFLKDFFTEFDVFFFTWLRSRRNLNDIRSYLNNFMDRKEAELKRKALTSIKTLEDKTAQKEIADQVIKDISRWGGYFDKRIKYEVKKGLDENIPQQELENRLKREIKQGKQYAGIWANTAEGAINTSKLLRDDILTGDKYFKYSGPATDRPFCSLHIGKTYSLEKIEAMDNGQGLSVLYYRGGYNCRHRWRPVNAEDINIEDRGRLMKDETFQESSKKYNYEKAIINSYTKRGENNLHTNLNRQLIRNSINAFNDSYERQLSKALKRMPIYEGKVYRGVTLEKETIERYRKKIGEEISEPMFISAAKKQELAYDGNVRFEIISVRARDIKKLSDTPKDDEILFDSFTKFIVYNVSEKNGKTIIQLKEKI